ncbi:MAG: DUF3987 domain-containing protein [Proteobacteria bacterium]|nr:DUF3987 domain-containing protein [Pseudomonadota bacterium]
MMEALRTSDGPLWPPPEELPDVLPDVPDFDDRLLPDALRPWLSDVSDRTQCPPEYLAVGAIVALGAVVGRGCCIRPKKRDDWTVVPNLWGALVGPPSSMKSPALAEALTPLRMLERQARETYKREALQYEFQALVADSRKRALQARLRKDVKQDELEALRKQYQQETATAEPVERRYIVNDATVEKLGVLLRDNQRGLLHFRDELSGWLGNLDRAGRENDRAFYLESWNGDGSYTYDRIGRGTVHVEAACVSMLGGIQPGPLARHLRDAVFGRSGADGLVQRFQLLVYPSRTPVWRNIDRRPDTAARNQALAIYRRLDSQCLATSGSNNALAFTHFAPEGQEFFDGWRSELERRLRTNHEHEAVEAHLTKYRSLMPALALLSHLADTSDGHGNGVELRHAQRAAALCDLLEAHARRVYSCVAFGEGLHAAWELRKRLQAGELRSPFTMRDVYRRGWPCLRNKKEVEPAVHTLEEYGWLRVEDIGGTGGRRRHEIRLHPLLERKR